MINNSSRIFRLHRIAILGKPIVNKTVYNTMLKAARKALKLARDPKEQKRAQARIDRIISMGFTKNVRSLGSKAVQSVKDKVTKNNKELTNITNLEIGKIDDMSFEKQNIIIYAKNKKTLIF